MNAKEFEELNRSRNQIVEKENSMIQRGRSGMTAVESKATLYLISKILPGDTKDTIYEFDCKEFLKLINRSEDTSYTNVKAMLSKMAKMNFWMDVDDDESALIQWFSYAHIKKSKGVVKIKFHEDMFPFLQKLNEEGRYYIQYKVQNVALMKSKYAIKIYELLKSYQLNNRKWIFENGTGSKYDLQRRIADVDENNKSKIPENWSNWAVFKRDVLEPAKKEINKYTDLVIEYEGKKEDIHHKRTRAVRTIAFYMVGKTEAEKENTQQLIDREYGIIEDSYRYHQMSIEEMFFDERQKKLEEEKEKKAQQAAQLIEKQIDNSKYQLLAECTEGNFSEEKLEFLYFLATNNRTAGAIDFNQWEMFATDIVNYYYKKIQATPEKTKTTVYDRLSDMVKNDYDNIVPETIEKYSN